MNLGMTKDYSNMLNRLAASTCVVSLICTIFVVLSSPYLQKEIHFLNGYLSTAGFRLKWLSIPIVYAVPALAVTTFARIVMLHDRISDLFGIRSRFDTKYILIPMAQSVGITVSPLRLVRYRQNRDDLMGKVFYEYASYLNPVIGQHLVQMALDKWTGFWMAIEALPILVVTDTALLSLHGYKFAECVSVLILCCLVFMSIRWKTVQKTARDEVVAIVADTQRAANVRNELR